MDADRYRTKINDWQSELDRLNTTWRWGDTRRFQTNTHKIGRRAWLIRRIADAKTRLQKLPS